MSEVWDRWNFVILAELLNLTFENEAAAGGPLTSHALARTPAKPAADDLQPSA
jgi:hypothetical protein